MKAAVLREVGTPLRIDMPREVDSHPSGKLELDEMVSQRLELDQVNEAAAALEGEEIARSVIVFEG